MSKNEKMAMFDGKNYFVITNLTGVLGDLRRDKDMREYIIELHKRYLMICQTVDSLCKRGVLEQLPEENYDPDEDYDLMAQRFARLLRKEFPEDWRACRVKF